MKKQEKTLFANMIIEFYLSRKYFEVLPFVSTLINYSIFSNAIFYCEKYFFISLNKMTSLKRK